MMIPFHIQSKNATRCHSGAAMDAFSLIELLVVLAIASILIVVTLPSLSSALSSSKLNSASQTVADSIGQARQEAVTKDRNVQVRFYNITTGALQGWRALQVVRVEQTSSGSTLVPVTKVRLLPDGVIISPTPALSPLLTADSAISGTVNLPVYGNVSYAGFYFLPSGSIENAVNSANNFLHCRSQRRPARLLRIIVPSRSTRVTGKVITYRP